jgi:hypothetical protein
MNWAIQRYWYTLIDIKITIYGGERGIRTLDTLLTYTPLAGARLQPLGHFSVIVLVGSEYIVSEKTTPP